MSAARIHSLLHGQTLSVVKEADQTETQPILDVYFDQMVPGVEDWTAIHEPFLKRARAFIVICTPGVKLNEGRDDWVHREIDWWLEHREIAPILVDPLNENKRYIPDSIANKWPNAQRIKLLEKDWEGLSGSERLTFDQHVRNQLIGSIIPSQNSFYRLELEQERKQAARLKRTRRTVVGLAAGLLILAVLAFWIYTLKNSADLAAEVAITARIEAEEARQLTQIRVNEGQATRTNIEAQLLGILQQFGKYKNYESIMKEWETNFRTRADALLANVTNDLPDCHNVGAFTVYEQQLVVALDDLLATESMYAYLAVVPGSSSRKGDWAPAVLNVFFAERDEFTPTRNLSLEKIKTLIKTVPTEDRWDLLMGLGTPHVLTRNNKNYRIDRSNLSMRDDGDMIMAFEVCQEIVPEINAGSAE